MTEDTDPGSGRRAVLEELIAEQSLRGAILGGLGAALVASALWLGLALTFEEPVRLHAAFSGILVGFGLRNWGRGLERRFAVLGAFFTFLALVFGALLSGAALAATRSRLDLLPFLGEFLTLPYAFKLVTDNLAGGGFLFWAAGMVLGWNQSYRKLSRARLGRIRATE